jgi:hypothetical protein
MGRGLIRAGILLLPLLIVAGACAQAAELPPIIATTDNAVPSCVKPNALMQFVLERNARQQPPRKIESRFEGIAALYRSLGECVASPPQQCVGVRWDYAFFQMLIETNYLTFLRPNGAPASVLPADNNFAGVGAAVSGKPGERFTDMTTGVLAHLQHVLMYSTTRIPEPVAKRTRQVQDDVQSSMRRLQRPITFSDLARVWAGTNQDRYGAEIQRMAEKYASRNCGHATIKRHLSDVR